MERPQRGFPYDSTLPLLAAFVGAVAFLGLIAVYANSGGADDPGARAAATTERTTTATTATATTPAVAPRVALTVTTAGDGRGTVRIDDRARDCSDECRTLVDRGTTATLVARPADGSKFVSWAGACGSPRRCSLTMDRARSVIALFALAAPAPAPEASCEDGVDDDGDGFVDSDDPECLIGNSEDAAEPIVPPVAPPPPVLPAPPPPGVTAP